MAIWSWIETVYGMAATPPNLTRIQDLVEAVRDRNLEFMDYEQTDNLKSLHKQLISSADIIDDTIGKIKASIL